MTLASKKHRIRELASQFKSDAEIGKILGEELGAIRSARLRYGIDAGRKYRERWILEVVKAGVEAGMSDPEIAKKHGLNKSTVCSTRRRKLEADAQPRRKFTDANIQTIREMASQGKRDAEIGGVLNCSEAGVKRQRELHGIMSGYLQRAAYNNRAVRDLCAEGLTTAEIGQRLGITQGHALKLCQENGVTPAMRKPATRVVVPKIKPEPKPKRVISPARLAMYKAQLSTLRRAFSDHTMFVDEELLGRVMAAEARL